VQAVSFGRLSLRQIVRSSLHSPLERRQAISAGAFAAAESSAEEELVGTVEQRANLI
jgi:hypothetical protein